MRSSVLSLAGSVVSEIELPSAIFCTRVRKDVMHQVICWQLAKRRSGTHMTKTEGEVEGSTRKIYQQKGTGRARHGIIRAAQFRGGGVIFGPRPRSYEYKVNKKVRFLGLCSALSHKFAEGALFVLENLDISSCKTTEFIKTMRFCDAKSVVIVDKEISVNVKRASKNVHTFLPLPVLGINVYDIMRHEKIVFTLAALEELNKRVKK